MEEVIELTKEQELQKIKEELANSDYMILKCWEAEKLGLPLSYTAEEIHAIKQPLRDRINALQAELE